MANEVVLINGVTKKERNGIYRYTFGANVNIDASPASNSMIIYGIDKHRNHVVSFDDVTDKLGAANIEEYCDALAALGYYRTTIDGTITVDTAGLATSAKQDEQTAELQTANTSLASIDAKTADSSTGFDVNNTVLNNILQELKTITAVLKSIAQ